MLPRPVRRDVNGRTGRGGTESRKSAVILGLPNPGCNKNRPFASRFCPKSHPATSDTIADNSQFFENEPGSGEARGLPIQFLTYLNLSIDPLHFPETAVLQPVGASQKAWFAGNAC